MRTLLILIAGIYLLSICCSTFRLYPTNIFFDKLLNACIDCIYCPRHSTGVHPNCICENGATYNELHNDCMTCHRSYSSGDFPMCICQGLASVHLMEWNECSACPPGSTGDYPNCKCDNAYYDERHNYCIKCPTDATGVYPACKCSDASLTFSAFINQCYLPCPNNSSGIQPNCACDYGYYYDANNETCKNNTERMCPAGSIGIGSQWPHCLCMTKNEYFDSSTWKCGSGPFTYAGTPTSIKFCPDNNGKWPQCGTEIDVNVLRSCVG